MKDARPKILIVEDDKFLLKAYKIKFERAGFDITTAVDGAMGLTMAEKDHPALIILDLMVPMMNGFEFLKKIKEDDRLKGIPVVVLSNLSQEIDKERAMKLGAKDYLIKANYRLEEIVEKVKKCL